MGVGSGGLLEVGRFPTTQHSCNLWISFRRRNSTETKVVPKPPKTEGLHMWFPLKFRLRAWSFLALSYPAMRFWCALDHLEIHANLSRFMCWMAFCFPCVQGFNYIPFQVPQMLQALRMEYAIVLEIFVLCQIVLRVEMFYFWVWDDLFHTSIYFALTVFCGRDGETVYLSFQNL